jgi:hypothetical protein
MHAPSMKETNFYGPILKSKQSSTLVTSATSFGYALIYSQIHPTFVELFRFKA